MSEPIHYRIRAVNSEDPDTAYWIMWLHRQTFADSAPMVSAWSEHAWLAAVVGGGSPVGFATMRADGYLSRSGVLPAHRGHGLQRRLINARVGMARRMGLTRAFSDTTDNTPSAASLAHCGFATYQPKRPHGFKTTLYWEKHL